MQNALLVVVALFQLGTLWERQQGTNAGVAAALSTVRAEVEQLRREFRRETETTYARRDVIDVELDSIKMRLEGIELQARGGQQNR